jgi:hypothetical protein
MNTQASKQQLGQGMGWFGVALGTAEILFPRVVARVIGVDPRGVAPVILRAMGVREIAASAIIFAKPESLLGRWSRVVGDALDLGLITAAALSKDTGKLRLAGAAVAVLGAAALDVISVLPQEDAAEVAPPRVTRRPKATQATPLTV